MDEIDLGRLADGYAHRPASEASRQRARREAVLAGIGPGSVAVDVGGGRGDHAEEFAASGALALVVDRSPEMAAAARRRVRAVVGEGSRLPLRDEAADLVFFHASIHYGRWEPMLAEAVRVLRPGARVAVWTFSAEHARGSFLSRWFPSVARIDAGRFPDPGALAGRLEMLGCEAVSVDAEVEVVERSADAWVRGVRGGFVSTLQLLPPGELEEGLERFRSSHPDPDELLLYELDYRRVAGWKPGLP